MVDEFAKEMINGMAEFKEFMLEVWDRLAQRARAVWAEIEATIQEVERRCEARKGWGVILPERKRTVSRYRSIKAVARSALQ
ncbi:hypothetical protein R3398_17140 [Rossellomorea marisflavi]|uniref:hypothetical protein n=1 Tax=Rossellomorea marisflavi TaxID=189381 RepID=UPI00296F6826|nr:hypothetical protein [Rossellomorea marisflavi]MDW4528094.1 hypothetical protein [Rossellomorea marisflavi]